MYFSTFVLVMIITVGGIAFGGWLIASFLQALTRSLLKMRPERVVSHPDHAIFGEVLEAERSEEKAAHSRQTLAGRTIDGEVIRPAIIFRQTLTGPR